ncbi:MAG: ATP-binding protein [Deltaproteobacteria bacterium]|nr:ATP-binding protein [Deltaproteobacteria bacterium]
MLKNNLFVKICLSFWLTTLFMIGAVLTVDWMTETGPFHSPRHPMPGGPFAVHGQAYTWILEHEGVSSLRAFAARLYETTGIREHFFDDQGADLTGRAGTGEAGALAALALKQGNAGVGPPREGGMEAVRIPGAGGKCYAIVTEIPPFPPPQMDNYPPFAMNILRLLVVLFVSGAICYVLARYLTAPILKLGVAARQFAVGDLSVRVHPALGRRKDEISTLARDFDGMAERIESLLNSQRLLLRDISHELRSPLARLNVALELCRRGADPEIEKSLDRIERESSRLNDMIEHLLTLNRVEAGTFVMEKTSIDLGKLIWEIVADADYEAKSHNRRVKADCEEGCLVVGNEEFLRRAIDNVARNAVRYTRDGSTVEVSLRRIKSNGDSYGVMAIRDHGRGVPEEEIPNLFKPFFRVSGARERETGGTGLGLAITEASVRLHGGTVRAANSPGGGLVVEISLPLLSSGAETESTV